MVMITVDGLGEGSRVTQVDGAAPVTSLGSLRPAGGGVCVLSYSIDEADIPLASWIPDAGGAAPLWGGGAEPTIAQVMQANGPAGAFVFENLDDDAYLARFAHVRPAGREPRVDEVAVAGRHRLPWKRLAAMRRIRRRAAAAVANPAGGLPVVVRRDRMNPKDRTGETELEREVAAHPAWTGADLLTWARDSGFLPRQGGAIWVASVSAPEYAELGSLWADNGRTFTDGTRLASLQRPHDGAREGDGPEPVEIDIMYYAGSGARMRSLQQYRVRGIETPAMAEELDALQAGGGPLGLTPEG